jgi:hypothetical protein
MWKVVVQEVMGPKLWTGTVEHFPFIPLSGDVITLGTIFWEVINTYYNIENKVKTIWVKEA